MNIEQLLSAMTPDIYERLCQCVETGKWLDGAELSDDQKSQCMQAIMAYQAKVGQSGEHMTVGSDGNIVHKSKSELRQELRQETAIKRFGKNDI